MKKLLRRVLEFYFGSVEKYLAQDSHGLYSKIYHADLLTANIRCMICWYI